MDKLRISKLSNTIVLYTDTYRPQPVVKKERISVVVNNEEKRLNQLSNKQASRIKKAVRYMFHTNPENLYWVTITTCQHLNGMSDEDCKKVISMFIDAQRLTHYALVCERQQNGSIHFHIMVSIIPHVFKFDIKACVRYLNPKLPYTGTNVFNVKKVSKTNHLGGYMTKLNSMCAYMTKEQVTFACKASQISYAITKVLNDQHNGFELTRIILPEHYMVVNDIKDYCLELERENKAKSYQLDYGYIIHMRDLRELNVIFNQIKNL